MAVSDKGLVFAGVLALALFLQLIPASSAPIVGNATIPLLAVIEENETGFVTHLDVEIVPGRGRTLITTEPFIGIDTQNSERIAKEIAEKITGISLNESDVVITIRADSGSVEGPSAGVPITVALISAMTGLPMNSSILATGTIDTDGSIGAVGGVLAKAKAASEYGARALLIPIGTSVEISRSFGSSNSTPGVVVDESRTTKTDVIVYGREKLRLDVRQVTSINEVVPQFFPGYNRTLPEVRIEEIPLENETYSESEELLRNISEASIRRARELANLSGSDSFEERLAGAENLFRMNYFYSAANEAFLVANAARELRERNLTEIRTEVALEIGRMGALISALNSTPLPKEELSRIASGEQRYLWAVYYYENFQDDLASMISASEWLRASSEILGSQSNYSSGILRQPLLEKAAEYFTEARRQVSSAQTSGRDTILAERSLVLAEFALRKGLPLPAIYDSIDAEAYAVSSGYYDGLAELVGKAKELQIEGATDPWAISYLKHSRYLLHKASVGASRTDARSAVFLALRALGIENSFRSIPKERQVVPAIQLGNTSVQEFLWQGRLSLALSIIAVALSALAFFRSGRRVGGGMKNGRGKKERR